MTDWITLRAWVGVYWASGEMVLLLISVWSTWQSSPSDIILIWHHPFLPWSSSSGLMSKALRKSRALVWNSFQSSAWFGEVKENLGASQCRVFLEAIFCLLWCVFQKGSWNGGSIEPNGPEKGVAAAVSGRGSWNGGMAVLNGPEKGVAAVVFWCLLLERRYGRSEGLEKGVALGVWLFKWGCYSSCLLWEKVFIFFVDMGWDVM